MKKFTLKKVTLKRVCIIAMAVSTLALISSSVNAQTPSAPSLKPKIYVGGGIASITNPDFLESSYDPSFSLLLGVGLPFTSGFEAVAKIQLHNYSFREDLTSLGFTDPDLRIRTIGADVKWPFGPPVLPVRPYVLLGVGNFTLKNNSVSESIGLGSLTVPEKRESSFYFNAGVGVDVSLGPTLAFFLEAKYTILNTLGESTGILPIVAGIRIL